MARVERADLHVPNAPAPRTALIHDFLVSVRGADRVFFEICDLYPDADIFTPIYDEKGTGYRLSHRRVHTSYLQRMRPNARTFRSLLPLYPAAVESMDLTGFDLVISSSSAWAHAVICDPDAVHVSYCHNPFRYAWNERHRVLAERRNPIERAVLSGLFRRWREWDWVAAQRVDHFLTNSRTTQSRIRSFFGREAQILHPPVDTSRFYVAELADHYLLISELVSHKRIDDAVRAFTRLGLPLVVVGGGPQARKLRRMAGPTVSFAGRLPDSEVDRLLATCRALVVTAVEEFGIAAVEAQAAGRPVIARSAGGSLETVEDGVTGTLWSGGVEELAAAVLRFDPAAIDPSDCLANAARFDAEVFRRRLPELVKEALSGAGADHDAARRELRRMRVAGGHRLSGLARPLR